MVTGTRESRVVKNFPFRAGNKLPEDNRHFQLTKKIAKPIHPDDINSIALNYMPDQFTARSTSRHDMITRTYNVARASLLDTASGVSRSRVKNDWLVKSAFKLQSYLPAPRQWDSETAEYIYGIQASEHQSYEAGLAEYRISSIRVSL